MKSASFCVDVLDKDRLAFADLSGDRNPLHVDESYAASTNFGRCILHGAFSGGLISRLAGMYLPGKSCILHSMSLRFLSAVVTPIELSVSGEIVSESRGQGWVDAVIREKSTGRALVEAKYNFSHHSVADLPPSVASGAQPMQAATGAPRILVTGASGGLGAAVKAALGADGLGIVRRAAGGDDICIADLAEIDGYAFPAPIAGIVHCAWPAPLEEDLLGAGTTPEAVQAHVTQPLLHCMALGRLLKKRGVANARLVVVGSSFASPGRHAWRYPLYSLAKGMLPTLVQIMAKELAASGHQVAGVALDMFDGGMNRGLSKSALQSNADRTLTGELPGVRDVAREIAWVLNAPGNLVSGAMLDLTGGAIP